MVEIASGLDDAESPLAFVQRNLARLHAENPATRPAVTQEAPQPIPQPTPQVANPDAELNKVIKETEVKRGEIEKQAESHAKAIEEELAKTAESAARPEEKAEDAPVQADNEGAEESNPEE